MINNIKKLFFENDILKFELSESSFLRIGTGGDFEAGKQDLINIIKNPKEDYEIVCDDGFADKYLVKIVSDKNGLYLQLHKSHNYAERCHGDEDETYEEQIVLCQGNKEKQMKFLEQINKSL